MNSIEYNEKYFFDDRLHKLKPKEEAFLTFKTNDNIIIGLFQGARGQFPELDFIIKILRPGRDRKPFPPPHTIWVVDVLLKVEKYQKEVLEFMQFYINFYETCKPFESVEERNNYKLQTVEYIKEKYKHVEDDHTLSLDYVATIIELFSLNEKRTKDAYWFKEMLSTLLAYAQERADYMDVMMAAQPGF